MEVVEDKDDLSADPISHGSIKMIRHDAYEVTSPDKFDECVFDSLNDSIEYILDEYERAHMRFRVSMSAVDIYKWNVLDKNMVIAFFDSEKHAVKFADMMNKESECLTT